MSWKLADAGVTLAVLTLLVAASWLDRAHDQLQASAAPNAPIHAVVADSNGIGLPNDSWSSTGDLNFRVTLEGNADVRTIVPEFEILPAKESFTGTPNVAGSLVTMPSLGRAVIRLPVTGLVNGTRYHWRVRTRSLDGNTSPWIGSGTFGLSETPPTAPQIVSENAPSDRPTNLRTISLHWSQSYDRTGIAFYQWANSQDASASPTWHATRDRLLHLHYLSDGKWYITVRAVNGAGVVSAPLRWSVWIDRTAPTVENLTVSSRAVGIANAPSHVRFLLPRPASAFLNVLPTGNITATARISLGALPAGTHDVVWSGKDSNGNYLQSGQYRLSLSTIDPLGNRADLPLPSFTVGSQRIVVSLTKQDLTVYDGSSVLLHTLITSGGPETQTPIGTFNIIAKFSPFVMHSPWPKTSRLWYPDSPVHFALLFRDGGFFLHDSPWRTAYGPGTNAVDGIPGGNTTGTHGCVNVPLAAEAWIAQWAHVGTVVQILP